MFKKVPLSELQNRQQRFRKIMDAQAPEWEMAVIFNKINLYYLTGTMQEGMLVIPRNNNAVLWVRRSFERAASESFFPGIRPMDSFKDAAATHTIMPGSIHLETEFLPLAFLKRFQKYFPIREILPLDAQIAAARSVKSPYEIDLMKKSGDLHRIVLEERVPLLLKEGMSEVEFAGDLYGAMLREGHHGVARFAMFDTEIVIGHIAFGESSIFPTSFNGPGGNYGMGPAVPIIGNRNRKLRKGDLVFIDIGFGVEGYHTDKTLTYIFGGKPDQTTINEHTACVDIQNRLAEKLKPGAIPSKLYEGIMNNLPKGFLRNFMGFGSRQVKFLGHGIGLVIDEIPVIAKGFDAPLEENMVMALEPKKGIENIGMVGIENTFIVTPNGGQCITGYNTGLVCVN
ncbi:MAG: aminopeptidase P family protein [Bacteroidales bacterium]|nr:aminopeptidase P family protein [Bacteroidales bacterium]